MKLLFTVWLVLFSIFGAYAQSTSCPAPRPRTSGCYQTSRPRVGGSALTNWPPIPNQDCCNAIALCFDVNEIKNGVIIPVGAPDNLFYPGCVRDELPDDRNTCFANNEKGTTWYKFQVRPLPGGSESIGAPAGKLRFKIIPKDVGTDPDYDELSDSGRINYGDTDYDFLLFKIPSNFRTEGAACTAIKNSSSFGAFNSIIASCNWNGTYGPTGLFEPGAGTESSSGRFLRFNKPLDVFVGDLFYLAIDNFSINQQGFTVDFRGLNAPQQNTAIVAPPLVPFIKIATIINPNCSSKQFTLRFDNPVRCDSVKPNKFLVKGSAPNYTILNITPEGGCNFGDQDTSFVFTISPSDPDTTLEISITNTIRDICGNAVVADTNKMRIEYPTPLVYNIVGEQPSCGKPEITIQFTKPVFCDSVKSSKFKVLRKGAVFGKVLQVRRANGLACSIGSLDTTYVLTLSQVVKDSTNFSLALDGVVTDFCGNPVLPDTFSFKVNPFLTIKADPKVACPKKTILVTGILDSTFKDVSNDFITYAWTNLNNGETLVEDDSTTITNPRNTVKIKRDLVVSENVTYQVVVQNIKNNCVDTAKVSVLFSARPNLIKPDVLTYCFGENIAYKPQFTNAKSSELTFFWSRATAQSVSISTDSIFTQTVVDSIIQKGLEQVFTLRTKYLDSLGGCSSDPLEFKIRYGRKIEPKIDLDSLLRNASITPAEFTFNNLSTFEPSKFGAKYEWNFGQGDKQFIFGNGSASSTYVDGREGGLPYTVTLTAIDTVMISTNQIGRICNNSDTTYISVQNLIPSLITSNGDKMNDFLFIKGMKPNTFSMKLYNRWGKLVGEQDPLDYQEGWDPKDLGNGNYYYILTEKRSGKTIVSWLAIKRD